MLFFLILGCAPEPEPGSDAHIRRVTGAVEDDRLAQADAASGDWLSYGRNLTFGTVLMGRKTYEVSLKEGKTSPYPAMRQTRLLPNDGNEPK